MRSTRVAPTGFAVGAVEPSANDPTRVGLVATGIFAPPRGPSGYSVRLRAAAEREIEADRIHEAYSKLEKLGFVRDRQERRLIIHGTGVPVCTICHMWGHKAPASASKAVSSDSRSSFGGVQTLCPLASRLQSVGARAQQLQQHRDYFKRMRAASIAGTTISSGKGRQDNSDDDDLLIASSAKHDNDTLDRAAVSKHVDMPTTFSAVRARAGARASPAAQRFAQILEKFLVDMLCDDSYAVFREPVSLTTYPGYARIRAPMDLSTLRTAVVARRYRFIEDFYSDLRLIYEASLDFNKEAHRHTKRAKALIDRCDEWMKENAKELQRLQTEMRAEITAQRTSIYTIRTVHAPSIAEVQLAPQFASARGANATGGEVESKASRPPQAAQSSLSVSSTAENADGDDIVLEEGML